MWREAARSRRARDDRYPRPRARTLSTATPTPPFPFEPFNPFESFESFESTSRFRQTPGGPARPEALADALASALAERERPTVLDVVVTRDASRMLPGVDSRTVEARKGDRVA